MNKEVINSLAWGVGILVLALIASFARSQGWIDTDMTNRIVMGAIGLMIAWFGNNIPKRFVPSSRAKSAQRVAGWSLALSGLVYAGLWAFAPHDVAVIGGCAAVIAGMIVTFGYCLTLKRRATAA